MDDRRNFLRGLVSLPLIGGGLTLIGRPSAPIPLVQAAAMPTLDDPRQRACYAWAAFSLAMRELTSEADGWLIVDAGERYRTIPNRPAESFMRVAAIRQAEHRHPQVPHPFYSEHHDEFDL